MSTDLTVWEPREAMRYDRQNRELDLRLEADDLTVERISECLNYCEVQCKWPVDSIVIRHAQRIAVMKDGSLLRSGAVPTMSAATPSLTAVFGASIVEKEDGLTPRQRSVLVALAEFPPTRAEQVEAYVKAEREVELARLNEAEIPFGF